MGDGDIIKLGASADLTIQHDGSNSYIKDEGTGNLYIRTDGTTMNLQAGSDNAVKITKDAQVELFYDNSVKLSTEGSGIQILGATNDVARIAFGDSDDVDIGFISYNNGDNHMQFATNATERIRIFSGGNTTFSTTNQSPAEGTAVGARIGTTGKLQLSATGDQTAILNRVEDGSVLGFRSAGTAEGGISISGNTVSFNAFSGSHWSRLTDNSKPTILKGTIVENIDEMCDWYQVEFKVDGSTQKASYALKDGEKVGDTITYTYKQDDVEDADYSATIIKEDDNKHTKCKISDTADSKKVYGVYSSWDNDDDTVNDMYVTAIGTHVVRINKDVTVSAGDLLSSNGDGTAKVQDDDIIRSKTIGKVLTNIKQETYSDGSYTVPCALYCG